MPWETLIYVRTNLPWPIRVVGVERLTIQPIGIIYFDVAVVKEGDVGRILAGNTFADGAVTSVVVYRFVCRMCVYMVASPGIFG